MPDSPRILLTTPSDVQLEPATRRVEHFIPLGTTPRRGSHTNEFAFLALGSAAGNVDTNLLLDTIDDQDDEAVLLLPLATYDWLYEVRSLSPRLLVMLPRIGRGILMIVP